MIDTNANLTDDIESLGGDEKFLFISRNKRYKFDDWFWISSQDICSEHAYASARPSVIKNMWCVLFLRLFLLLAQIGQYVYFVLENLKKKPNMFEDHLLLLYQLK